VSQRGLASGRFTFSADSAGDHRICFTASSSSGRTGWLSSHAPNGGIKLVLDLVIGETNEIQSTDKGKLEDLTTRVKDLHARLQDIRREQVFQRVRTGGCLGGAAWSFWAPANLLFSQEREAEFRDQSETTNSRVIRWMLIQLTILGVTCAWQLSHLRSFFIKQKLT
jgi:hypothetical protein